MSSLSASETVETVETAESVQTPAPAAIAEKPLESPPAIKVEDLHLYYRTKAEANPTLKAALIRKVKRQKVEQKVIKAVQGVSFEVPHGTVLGVIGHNGAGKSTLLRALSGILPPTQGRVEVRGRVSTLLALGVGFNQNLTGRENIVLGGLAQGWSKDQIREKENSIIDFADLDTLSEGAIDRPMKTYSSGMYARVAFAVGVHMDPDILLVDEALSAGDARFKERATEKMLELCENARTIVLVSHGLETVRHMSNHCIWMDHGNLVQSGDPDEVIDNYIEKQHKDREEADRKKAAAEAKEAREDEALAAKAEKTKEALQKVIGEDV
ncbi:ABC transporter ATP-binding protein [Catenulispora pinisilvae]|uniref:ABC transporter ATP-binding protein n=1 Tax=Catenulispora pinisilvae TaxID=2705253 RepID=UPI0018914C0A|nr:ABC transporter ATP-binding protein [Catenulispora pinisilvae]